LLILAMFFSSISKILVPFTALDLRW
jgi:hypothetical protein